LYKTSDVYDILSAAPELPRSDQIGGWGTWWFVVEAEARWKMTLRSSADLQEQDQLRDRRGNGRMGEKGGSVGSRSDLSLSGRTLDLWGRKGALGFLLWGVGALSSRVFSLPQVQILPTSPIP